MVNEETLAQLRREANSGEGTLLSRLQHWSAEEVISWALETFGTRVAICTSFQAEGMAIVDLATRIEPQVRVFTIDTGRLPPETYELIDRVRDHYQRPVEVYSPDQRALRELVTEHGTNLFYRSVPLRLRCCQVRKADPLRQALAGLDAWVTGLRWSQTETRTRVAKVEPDPDHGHRYKVNPLADWSSRQVWDYLKANQVPYNRLYDQGYTSIGCAPCTRAITDGEHLRAGRWWWEANTPKECGLHYKFSPEATEQPG